MQIHTKDDTYWVIKFENMEKYDILRIAKKLGRKPTSVLRDLIYTALKPFKKA